ncbi:MAG TPA: hypothetical protein VI756_29360, partial [Blastocatellia bacterium]
MKAKALGVVAAGTGILLVLSTAVVFNTAAGAQGVQAGPANPGSVGDRYTLAVRYKEGDGTSVSMIGTS